MDLNPKHAAGAARSALCASEQGRFREMHTRLMTTETWKLDTNWLREARAAGLEDTTAFASCLHSERITKRLREEQSLVTTLHVMGTPTFVAPGAVHQGAATTEELLTLRPRELEHVSERQ
jgi:protein-disulfide isomerase